MNVSMTQKARDGRINALQGLKNRNSDSARAVPLLLKPSDIPHAEATVAAPSMMFKSSRTVEVEQVLIAA